MEERDLRVVMATPELLNEVAANARQEDIDELWASNTVTPEEAMSMGSKYGTTFVLMCEDKALCAFGIVPFSVLSAVGAPWMVGTKDLEQHARPFIRKCRRELGVYFSEWSRLFNFVDARNVKSIRWLRWLGFKILPPMPYGPFKMPFHPFIMEDSHV